MNKVKLGKICDLSIGFVGTVTTQYEAGGIPFLRTTNIKPYYIDDSDLKRITKEFHESQKKSQLFKDDIIMVHTGIPGICCVIDDKYNNSNCIDAIVIKPHKDEVDSYYLEAYMNTIGYKHIQSQQVGAVQKHFNLNDASDLEIFLPDISKQQIIGSVVKNINKKITINNRISAELEGLAKTIYDYWFLQFEFPNEEGKPYKSSGGKMVYNEELKREIPEEWLVANLMNNSLCSTIKPGVDFFDTKNYLPTANVNGEDIVDGDYVTFDNRESRANMKPSLNSVWFAKLKNSIKHITLPKNAQWFIDKYILSTGMEGLQCNNDSLAYIHCLIYSAYFERHKDILSHGATQEGVNDEDLKNIKLVIPDDVTLKLFAEKINPLLEMKMNNIKENQQLTSLRDWLLPILMNGQITFKKK